MKKIFLIIIISTTLIFYSCNNYSDLNFIVKNDFLFITNPIIDVALTGSKQIEGKLQIKYNQEIIGQGSITSQFVSDFKSFELSFNNLTDKNILNIIERIEQDRPLEINLFFYNEKKKIKFEQTVFMQLKKPPFSKIENIQGSKFQKVCFRNYDLLQFILKNNTSLLEKERISNTSHILKKNEIINVKVEVDTVYYKTFITRYPVSTNKYHRVKTLENLIFESINNNFSSIKTSTISNINNKFIVEENIFVKYSGDVGIYLININEHGDFIITQIGLFLADNIKPKFSRTSNCSFYGDSRIEGMVCLQTKDFFGYNPYNVPFVGWAHGDIRKIYVNNKSISFTIGKEIFFKQRIFLDGGYNRVPIKIIDKNGNIFEDYISITIESIKDVDIDIDISNEIYSDDY